MVSTQITDDMYPPSSVNWFLIPGNGQAFQSFENVLVICGTNVATSSGGECTDLIDLDGIMDSINDIYFPDGNWGSTGCDTLNEEQWTNYAKFWKVPNEDPCYVPLITSASESISQDVKNYLSEETFVGSICGAVCSWTTCIQVETLTQLATAQQEQIDDVQSQLGVAVEETQACLDVYTPCVEESLQCSVDLVDCQTALASASAAQEGKNIQNPNLSWAGVSLPLDQYAEMEEELNSLKTRVYEMEKQIFDLNGQVEHFLSIENINEGCETLSTQLSSDASHWERAVKESNLPCSFVPKMYCSKIGACKGQTCSEN